MRTSEAAYFIVLSEAAEIRSGDWIERLLSHAQRNNIGAVGAKLISSNSKIFAAGLILGEHGLILRAHHGFPENSHGDNGRICTAHNVSAVAGCIMVKRDVFESVGGFDPRFGCYAEIDFCLSARQRGYLVVYEPRAVVGISSLPCIGVTDHGDMPDMCDEERRRFFEKWGNLLKKGDPYYSPNLSIKREDFSFNV
jgi:hypothetical protein